ncbi:MAG: hypothetical protein JSW31_06475, partial [Burkholderiales bacterium]
DEYEAPVASTTMGRWSGGQSQRQPHRRQKMRRNAFIRAHFNLTLFFSLRRPGAGGLTRGAGPVLLLPADIAPPM